MKITLRALLIVAFCSSPALAAAPGRLCIEGSPCRDHECGQPVEPAGVPRTFQLKRGTAHDLGVLVVGATTIPCGGGSTVELRVSATSFPRRGTINVRLTDRNQRTWSLQLLERDLRSPIVVRVAAGTYDIVIDSSHYRTFRKSLRTGDRPQTLAVTLEPLPVLAGRVIERTTANGIGGAIVRTTPGMSVISDASGFFSVEADPDHWPATLTVSAAGFADTALALPRARRSATLDDVLLSRGGTITTEVTHPDPSVVTEIELLPMKSGPVRARLRAVPTVVADAAVAKFADVEPGRYLVVAKGKGAWQRHGEAIELAEGAQKSVQLEITPSRLTVHAAMRGEPLPGALVSLRSLDGEWEGRLETGSNGVVEAELWQTGEAMASVFVERLMNLPHFETRTIPEGKDFDWTLDVAPRRITGVVVDAGSGAPVPNAVVSLRVRGETSFAVRTRADAAGRFQFMPVPHGSHTIIAAAAAHLQDQVSYTFAAPEESREITIRLEGGTPVRLRVTDAAGAPVAGAVAMQYEGLKQVRLSATDAAGIAEIIVPDGETRDVYVIPRDGSFGITRVTSKSVDPAIRVPRRTSRIEIRAESETRQPIPNVTVALRYNGHLLPSEVVRELGRTQGARSISGADGRIVFDHMPAGHYEFWPAGAAGDFRAIFTGSGPRSPVTMTVGPGDNVAVLTFAPLSASRP